MDEGACVRRRSRLCGGDRRRRPFVIDGVPAGTYPIKMWHEGVALKRIIASLQQFEYEDPYEVTKQVVVTSGGVAEVEFELALRE